MKIIRNTSLSLVRRLGVNGKFESANSKYCVNGSIHTWHRYINRSRRGIRTGKKITPLFSVTGIAEIFGRSITKLCSMNSMDQPFRWQMHRTTIEHCQLISRAIVQLWLRFLEQWITHWIIIGYQRVKKSTCRSLTRRFEFRIKSIN